MIENQFTLSEKGIEIATESGLTQAIDDSYFTRPSPSTAEHFNRTSLWEGTDKEISEVMRAIFYEAIENIEDQSEIEKVKKMIEMFFRQDTSGLNWKIEAGSQETDNLLGYPQVINHIPIEPARDACLLGGLEASEFIEEYPDLQKELQEKYFQSYLSSAAFIGAVLASDKETPEHYIERKLDDIKVAHISCGGSFHGDFRISIQEKYIAGEMVNPLGEHVPYMPQIEQKTIAAYHSVEPEILLSTLHFLEIQNLSADEQIKILKKVLIETGSADPKAGNYADYGEDNLDQYIHRIGHEERWKTDTQLTMLRKGILSEDIVTPGDNELIFRMRIDDKDLVVENHQRNRPATFAQLRFSPDEIPDFISLMINSGGGRTDHNTLIAMVRARLVVLGEYNYAGVISIE